MAICFQITVPTPTLTVWSSRRKKDKFNPSFAIISYFLSCFKCLDFVQSRHFACFSREPKVHVLFLRLMWPSLTLIAGCVEESCYYCWENVSFLLFVFALKLAVRGYGKYISVLARNSLTSIYQQQLIFCKLKKINAKKCYLCFSWVTEVFCSLLLIYIFYC